MRDVFEQWLAGHGLTATQADWVATAVALVLLVIVAWIADTVSRRIMLVIVSRLVERSKSTYDDALQEHDVFRRLAHLAPAFVVHALAGWALSDVPAVVTPVRTAALVWMVVILVSTVSGLLNAGLAIYKTFPVSRRIPLTPVVQVAKILLFAGAAIFAFSLLLGKSPLVFFSGLGAMSAVLLLIFRDSILGLVAGVQLASNHLVEVDDWVEIPSHGIDGKVREVNLTTVVVQNFDKTISTVPAYSLISGSFKNWRGMSESGGRRIKRAVHLDIASIRFCDKEMIERFSRFEYIRDYIRDKMAEVSRHNEEKKVDTGFLVNGRHLTNVGTFRAYVSAYLRNHPQIHTDGLTFLVRQLPPGPQGLPIEIYVFSREQRWAHYEDIQADIFDHLLAVVPLFDLRVYQQPSGADVRHALAGAASS